ncbi:hypothetical protein Tco_1449357 [Tanacetum coccineum]
MGTIKGPSPLDNESWNNPRDFAKPVKAISLPQDVPSKSDRHLVELENQVQCLMEAHLAPKQSVQVNKITFSCNICSGPHDTQYFMENPEQAFVDYASSCTDEAGGKWYTFKPRQNNLGDTYNPSWKSHQNLSNSQSSKNQSNLEGLVSNFMASQDARLSKFEADFKQQQGEMTNKIDTVLKAITDRITGALPSEMVKNLNLNVNPTSLVLSAHSYLTKNPSAHLIRSIQQCYQNVFQRKYVESLELGKNGSAFIQDEMAAKIEDLRLFTLPCKLGDSKPFDTLADLGLCEGQNVDLRSNDTVLDSSAQSVKIDRLKQLFF